MTTPPAFGSDRLGRRLGPRGSIRRWILATLFADACAFLAAAAGASAAGGGWGAFVGFGVAFAALQTVFMIGLALWVRRRSPGRRSS